MKRLFGLASLVLVAYIFFLFQPSEMLSERQPGEQVPVTSQQQNLMQDLTQNQTLVSKLLLASVVVEGELSRERQGNYIYYRTSDGTGFNISPSGIIVTAYHVVKDVRPGTITIQFRGRPKQSARLIKAIPEHDIAILELSRPRSGLPYLKLADRSVAPMDIVCLAGYPEKKGILVESGIVSYVNLTIPVKMQGQNQLEVGTFAIGAQAYPGMSGGPVVNSKGEAVGVLVAAGTDPRRIECYAVPLEAVETIVKRLAA